MLDQPACNRNSIESRMNAGSRDRNHLAELLALARKGLSRLQFLVKPGQNQVGDGEDPAPSN